jgi:hypothetical protein
MKEMPWPVGNVRNADMPLRLMHPLKNVPHANRNANLSIIHAIHRTALRKVLTNALNKRRK